MTTRRELLWRAAALPALAQQRFTGALGLQMYSLRRQAAKDLPGTLALVRKLGFEELEVGGFYGKTAAEFQRLLAGHGLKAVSLGAEWNALSKSIQNVSDDASALGAGYVMCSAIPGARRLTFDAAVRAADQFNRWGEPLARAGLRFCYHPHGPEFVAGPDGTLFDTLAQRMDPKAANFEMDVFWFVFGNQDPARALELHPGRFPLMHVKDIRPGEPRTFDPGTVEEEASVPAGKGEVDWRRVLKAARAHGVRHYFIEEEHPNAVPQIKETLEYLKNLRL
ncbi:MAG: sugar phosphate isomerase/epimerase [Candidatus Solibacter usitatus]|nr:sugar phosphate isomerase/epimerase [Candidatus Solibacter usitatus]